MPSTQEFRRRIKSVNNTKQITKAMEMIASIKMQKSVKTIDQARAYIQNAWNILHAISKKALPEDHPLVNPKKINKTVAVLITSDRGLCGSYNAEVIKKFVQFEKEQCPCEKGEANVCGDYRGSCDVIAIGKVGAQYVNRYKIGKLIAEFKGFENSVAIEDIIPISKMSSGEYLAGHYDRVVLIYSHFASSIKQIPVVQQLLPITESHIDAQEVWTPIEDKESAEAKFEPSEQAVIDGILRQILRVQLFGAVLEANASEHSARMVAMKNATDSATDLIDELTLIYNSVRQSNITTEISEISAAAEAMR